ncbi:MAG: aspartyl protease family protein [Chitinophagaceae bacterium]|nr:aspartyl protease family protein [Chitinophagaceae bacterium]MBN8667375.1 aspartyl protease family protein [Chitinophagales bacterium]
MFGLVRLFPPAAQAGTSIPPVKISLPDAEEIYPSIYAIPFSRAGNLILVKAKADTTEGNFILDTGCPHLVLNTTYFRQYPVQESDGEGNGATTGTFFIQQTRVADFSFGGNHFYHTDADLTDLGSIENSRGIKVLGLIGVELLRKFELIIDYENNLIYLHRLDRKGTSVFEQDQLADTAAYQVVPIRIMDNRIMVESQVGGKKLRLVIDSGSEANLLDSRLPEKVFAEVSITGRTTMMGVGGKRIDVLKGELNTLHIGGVDIPQMKVLVTNLERTCFSHAGCVDGVLGFDFLSLKKIGFNFVKNKMFVWK